MVFVTALTSGLPLVVSRSVAGNTVSKNDTNSNKTVTAGLIIGIILAVVFCLFIIFAKPVFSLIFTDEYSYIILLTLIPFILFSGVYAPFKGFLWGKEKYFDVSLVEFVEQIIKIIICFILFLFIKTEPSLPAGIAISIACALSTLFGIFLYKKQKGGFSNPKGVTKKVLTSSMPLTLVRFIGSLVTPIIAIILPLRLISNGYTNEQALSLLGIAMGMTLPIINIPSTIVGSLSMALIPQLSILNKENNSYALKNQINSSVLFTIVCTFFIIPFFAGIGEPLCEFLFNNAQAGALLSKYAWIIVPNGLMQISTSILNSLGKEVYTFITYAIGGVVLFIGILFLPGLLGIEALLLSMGVNAIIVSTLNFIKLKKIANINLKVFYKLIFLSVIVVVLAIFCKYFYNVLLFVFPAFVSIILTCFVGAICYIIFLFVFNIVNYEFIFKLKKQLKKE